jgi:hypothetical protein
MHFILKILLRGHNRTSPELPWATMSEGPGECSLSHRRWPRTPTTASGADATVQRLGKADTVAAIVPSQRPTPRAVGASRGPSPVRGRPLLELGDPYFEADEVLGEFAGRTHLHQFFYTRSVNPSLSLCYLLRALSGYGVKIVHCNSLS